MTIDESMSILDGQKDWYDTNKTKAIDFAIDTMRKYQKIKEQVDIAIDKENFAISDARLLQIREIINGNDD